MSVVTVTMPLSQYEAMKEKIQRLEKESVRSYIVIEPVDITKDDFKRVLDLNTIRQDFGPLTIELKSE